LEILNKTAYLLLKLKEGVLLNNLLFLKKIASLVVVFSFCAAFWVANGRNQNLANENQQLRERIVANEEGHKLLTTENARLNEGIHKLHKKFDDYNKIMNQAFNERYENAQQYKVLYDEIKMLLTEDNCSRDYINNHIVERLRDAANAAGSASTSNDVPVGYASITDKSN
jgi:cell division protein FtsB